MKLARLGAATLAVVMTAAIVPAASYAAMDETLVEAHAQPVAHVKYGDLDLRKPVHVAELQHRVRRAATRICVDYGSRDLGRLVKGKACRDTAMKGAAPQITAAIASAGNEQLASTAAITVRLR